MKVISLHQPWASWVTLGWKTIETRTHDRFKGLVGQTIGIHAAKHWDNEWREKAGDTISVMRKYQTSNNLLINAPRGFIIATAFVDDFRLLKDNDSIQALCDCGGDDLFGLILSNIAQIEPIPMKGSQGIFNYDSEIIYSSRGSEN